MENNELKVLLSDFEHHSERLRRFVSNHLKSVAIKPVFIKIKWNMFNGYDCDLHDGELWIGYFFDNEFHGQRVSNIRCGTSNYMVIPCFDEGFPEYIDVTDEVIAGYAKKGMCYFDDFNHVFDTNISAEELEDGEIKTCVKCGKVYTKKSKQVTKHFWS